jgi:hypothetical protein
VHARAALERVREIADVDDHPDFLWAEGQLLLCEWRIDAAEVVLQKLVALEKSPARARTACRSSPICAVISRPRIACSPNRFR